jgi:hypothetical protein
MEEKELLEENNMISETPINNEIEERINELNLRAVELEIKLDQIEDKALKEADDSLFDDEYYNLKEEYKKLIKERKALKKELQSKDSSFLSKVSVWVVLYGLFSLIVSFPLVAGNLWLEFSNLLISLLSGAFESISSQDFIYKVVVFLIIFSLPLIINVITWTVYINLVKTKEDKKVFCGFWILEGLMSLGMIIFMCFQLYS